jgi:protein-tyrosine phosphatase
VVNLGHDYTYTHQQPECYWLRTTPDGQFLGLPWLEETVARILGWLREGKAVLVHCAVGRNRSSMVVAACLMARHHITADEALARIRRAWPRCEPKPHMTAGLREFEARLATVNHEQSTHP